MEIKNLEKKETLYTIGGEFAGIMTAFNHQLYVTIGSVAKYIADDLRKQGLECTCKETDKYTTVYGAGYEINPTRPQPIFDNGCLELFERYFEKDAKGEIKLVQVIRVYLFK